MPKAAKLDVITEDLLPGQETAAQTGTGEEQPTPEEELQTSEAGEQPEAVTEAEDVEEPNTTVFEYLKHRFTAEERLKLSEQLSQAVMERSAAEEELQTVKADFKSRITRAEATIADCARKINTGYEMRNVECELVKDFTTNTIRYQRLDTGEIVRERAMTSEERQRTLELVAPPTPQSL